MVTHRIANFIMLIYNLPSVRSSRFKPNVGNRMIRLSLSLSLSLSFILQSHHVLLLSKRSSSLTSRICTATKTTTMKTTIFFAFFFSFLHINTYIFDSFVHPQVKERKEKKGRTFATTASKFMYILSPSTLFFASVIFSLFLPTKWLRHVKHTQARFQKKIFTIEKRKFECFFRS
jgi:hypothetical protein